MFSCFFLQKLDEKSHSVGNMTKIKNCGVKPFRNMTSIKILLLCRLVQILEANEQAYWESKINPFMVILISWILNRFRLNLLSGIYTKLCRETRLFLSLSLQQNLYIMKRT
jgi:hypothetical protein